jgi:NADH dehydrogenase
MASRDSTRSVRRMPRVVVLGAGFAGAYCAREIERRLGTRVDLLVIDRHNFFVFHPLLVEAGIGNIEPRHVVTPIRAFLSRRARFRMAAVTGIDPERRCVAYRVGGEESDREAGYDHLVVAMGSVTSAPPMPGGADHCWRVKTLADAVALRDRAVSLLERANLSPPERRRQLLHLVVVGAGYTGIEVAGEFEEFLREGTRSFRNLRPDDVRVTVVERAPRILATMPAPLAARAQRDMERAGIAFRLGRSLASVDAGGATLDDGERLDSATVVWCAGIAQNPAAGAFPLERDARGFLLAETDGRARGHATIWAIGDGASNPRPGGGTYPPTAQAATRLGVACARNIVRVIGGGEPRAINFRDLGAICGIGRRRGVADVMGVRFSGFAGWWIFRTVYLGKMPGLGRKARIALDWTLELLFSRDVVQLGLAGDRRPPEDA